MQDLNDLYYFVQVVDHGGFAPAGRALGMPKSKLSRRIACSKSAWACACCSARRGISVTDVGQTFYEHCKAMLVEAEAAQEAIELTRARRAARCACLPHRPAAPPWWRPCWPLHARTSQ
jgi:DNA-binding transcriptional LysR family regulator